MKEQGFPFEKEADVPDHPKGVFILSFFEDKSLNVKQAETSKRFREMAHEISDLFPESTTRSSLLERLLDIRDTCVKKLK